MKKGIVSVGNWLVDYVKVIEKYPAPGNLTTIESVKVGLGGCAHNVSVNLAKMKTGFPVYAAGCIGDDANGEYVLREIEANGMHTRYMNIIKGVATSYTDVMAERGGASRTYFHCRGANAYLDMEHIEKIDANAKIIHLGYLLLLDKLDTPDPEYGTRTARLLKQLKEQGYKTSVDVVSEEGDRFSKIVRPCLPYIDYLIFNEIEAGSVTCLKIRRADGSIDTSALKEAAAMLMAEGVGELVAIHFPEGGYSLYKDGSSYFVPSFKVDSGDIVSTVGAGDAFCAAMLYAVHENYAPAEALLFANANARFNLMDATCTGGAVPVAKIKEFIASNPEQYSIDLI